ncbi:MAG: cell division protein FtsL [Alphaproteobacteria bacterium]|jgi:cell division protein FtsL|nr:cell division protein FtsL [Alphaproteobacteria bacterium]
MNIRVMDVCIILFTGLSFVAMVHIKTDVQVMKDKRERLVANERALKDELRVLKAEYYHVSRPERLEKVARQIGMVPMDMGQVKRISFEGSEQF